MKKKLFLPLIGLIMVFLLAGCSSSPQDYKRDQAFTAKVVAENYIEDILKSPSTAEFSSPDETRFTVEEEVEGTMYYIFGWVEAENSYGALIRTEYAVQLRYNGSDDFEVIDYALNE